MTTNIDHAIAIPTKQKNVWEQISEISRNHIWQADCEQIAFLSTMRTGRGTRWRVTMPNGKAYVVEITAWYEGLGYEYVVIDGMPYSKGKGRIRLQDAPEGTIVQWTFSYESTGFAGNVRNMLSTKRAIDSNIVNSLRNLYSYIKELKADEAFSLTDSKALLRDAPDVEARLQYQPRHPSALNNLPTAALPQEASLIPESVIVEPPVSADDTQPNPITTFTAETRLPEPTSISEPSFIRDLPAYAPTPQVEPPKEIPQPIPAYTPILPGTDQIDTGRVSVFDVFGVPKPSAVLPVSTPAADPLPVAVDPEPAMEKPIIPDVIPNEHRRRGLRAVMRERVAKTRIPSK